MRPPQRLADIDIAETGNDRLVEKGALERLALAAQTPCEIVGIQRIARRLGAEFGKGRVEVELAALPQMHEAETARVVVDDLQRPAFALHMDDNVIMLGILGTRVVEIA